MSQYNIGIDMGTSSIKALLLEDASCVQKEVSVEYDIDTPHDDWKEIEPEVWFAAAVKAVQKLIKDIDHTSITGIGITGQMHTTVFLNAEGQSIRPAIMWNDGRTKSVLAEMHEKMRLYPSVHHLRNTVTTGSPAANLYWLHTFEPESFSQLSRFLIGPDYLVYRLTGVQCTDYCDSSTSSLMDLYSGTWSDEMREIIGLKRSQYPAIHGAAEMAGTLLPEVARLLGLPVSVKVTVATGDNPATAIPTGCLGQGRTVISLGTSGVLMVRKSAPDLNAKGKNVLFSFDGKDLSCLCQGVVQATGNSVDWWVRKQLEMPDFSKIDEMISVCMNRRDKTIFFPYLTGDKTLYHDADIRGAFLGLSTETTRADMTFAVIEGLCLGFRELRDQMAVPTNAMIRVTGGGSKSRVWVQTLADVLNIPIERQDGRTGAAYGAALLSVCANGTTVDSALRGSLEQRSEIFCPRQERVEWYDQKYRWFSRIYSAVKQIYE